MGRKSQATAAEEEVYEIDKIVDYKEENGVGRWRIRWKGYGQADDTWEPKENIMTNDPRVTADMVKFRQQFMDKKKSGKKSEDHGKAATPKLRTSRPSSVRKVAKQVPKTRCQVAHVRKYEHTDSDFEVFMILDDGKELRISASEARVKYPEQLFDYLFKRIKFIDSKSAPGMH